jgi:hypothetical protein
VVKGVVLLVVDSASGLIFAPFVDLGEESPRHWQSSLERARAAGLKLEELRVLASDWAGGWWPTCGRFCVGLSGQAAQQAREGLLLLVDGVLDGPSYEQAEVALVRLGAHARERAWPESSTSSSTTFLLTLWATFRA